jgi:hypothetical protein
MPALTLPHQLARGCVVRPGRICVHHGIGVWRDGHFDDDEMMGWYLELVAHLSDRGWGIGPDRDVLASYPSIASRHRRGRRGSLTARCRVVGRHIEIALADTEPSCHWAPFATAESRVRIIAETLALVRKALSMGHVLDPGVERRLCSAGNLVRAVRDHVERRSFPTALEDFNDRWNFKSDWARGGRFERDESGWPTVAEYDQGGRNVDRDGVPLRNGMVRYLRDQRSGWRLVRGVIHTNMNNMWRVDCGSGVRYVSGRDLFWCEDASAEPRRAYPHRHAALRRELKGALETDDFGRVAAVARVLEREAPRALAAE